MHRLFNQFTASVPTSFRPLRPPENFVSSHSSTIWCIVWTCPHWQSGLDREPHLTSDALHRPWVVRKRFRRHHDFLFRSIPATPSVGSSIRWLFLGGSDAHISFHRSLGVESVGGRDSQIGCRDTNRLAGWLYTSDVRGRDWFPCMRFNNLAVTTSRRTLGGSILLSTRSIWRT